jgi:IMP dehydrogenase
LKWRKVKKSEWGMIIDPVTVEPDVKISRALELMKTYKISGVPVTIKDGRGYKLVGILTNRDLRFEEDLEQLVEARMTQMPLIYGSGRDHPGSGEENPKENRVEKLPVVDSGGYLRG